MIDIGKIFKPRNMRRGLLLALLFAPLVYLFGTQFSSLQGAHGEMLFAQGNEEYVVSEHSVLEYAGFKQYRIPSLSYDYSHSSASFSSSPVKMIGENQVESDFFWNGYNLQSTNLLPCFPNTDYRLRGPNLSTILLANGMRYYDANKNLLSTTYFGIGNFTTPTNAYYMSLGLASVYGNVYNDDIAIYFADNPRTNIVPYEAYFYNSASYLSPIFKYGVIVFDDVHDVSFDLVNGDYAFTDSTYSDFLFSQFFAHDNFISDSGRKVIQGVQDYGFAPVGDLIRFSENNMLHISDTSWGEFAFGYAYYAINVFLLYEIVCLSMFVIALPFKIIDILEKKTGGDL